MEASDGDGTSDLSTGRGADSPVRAAAQDENQPLPLAQSRLASGQGRRSQQQDHGLVIAALSRLVAPPAYPHATCPRARPRKEDLTAMRMTFALAVALGLAGCASVHPVGTNVAVPGMPNPEKALRQSMQHVDAEMAELGELSPGVTRAAGPTMPDDLQRIVSFQFNGPLDQAVAQLAQSIGYTFYTTAPPSTPPLTVSIQLSSVPAYQVFQALGAEAGTQATVQVDPLHHQVQVIHHA
jgi:defect-in-organelle-trafficking protein DotD